MKWNETKSAKNLQFKIIDDPNLIDQVIVDRNANHLSQVDGTPFTVEPLLSLIGKETFTTFSQEILDGKTDISKLQLSPTIQLYTKNLKQNKTIVNSATNNIIPYNEHIEGFKNWKEQTTTPPSERHLIHYQILLKPDEAQYSEEEQDFGERMMKLHHTIASIVIIHTSPLHRCLTSVFLLLPKDKGKLKINRLIKINTYESE